MPTILNAEPTNYSPQARQILQQLGELREIPLTQADLPGRLADVDVLIVRLGVVVDRPVMDSAPRLKAIVTATTGQDHIDTQYASARGIALLSLKGETAFLDSIPASAEHTWALLLALMRRVPDAYASVRAGAWTREPFRGHDLYEKRLGLVGVGRIGRKVANYGLAFGMRVSGYDPQARIRMTQINYTSSLPQLLERSDILSIHVPYDETTRHMIGPAQLAALPPGGVLVNTSRGGVVDETALLDSLTTGHLSGAALDVLQHEPRLARGGSSSLIAYAQQHDNLLITPHVAGATVESMAKTEVFMARKLARFLRSSSAVESAQLEMQDQGKTCRYEAA